MIQKIELPTQRVLAGKPATEYNWGYREEIGKLPVAARYAFSGAGSIDIETGIVTLSASETFTLYYGFMPGHMYRLEGTITGSASVTVTMGGTSAGAAWTVGSYDVLLKPTTGSGLGSITFVEGAAAAGTIEGLVLSLVENTDHELAYLS